MWVLRLLESFEKQQTKELIIVRDDPQHKELKTINTTYLLFWMFYLDYTV